MSKTFQYTCSIVEYLVVLRNSWCFESEVTFWLLLPEDEIAITEQKRLTVETRNVELNWETYKTIFAQIFGNIKIANFGKFLAKS